MSIEYSTGIYRGYPITNEQFDKINEMFPDFWDTYSNIVHCINSWTGKDGYFLGYCLINHNEDSGCTRIASIKDKSTKNDEDFEIVSSMVKKTGITPPAPDLYIVTLVY